MTALTRIAPTLLLTLVCAAPAAHANWLGIHVGSDGFGLSVGVGDWAPYGSSWHDPHWSMSYSVALDGYGEWVHVNGLGRVWRPYVAADWRPYTHGRWVYTSVGWTWVSYEPWGYVPHHYGEWAMTGFGWAWVPGYTYRPAHVVWVHSGAYIGWYPCAPRGWSHAHRGFHRYDGYGHSWGRTWGYNRGYAHGYDSGYWEGWRDARHATFVEWEHMTSDNNSRRAVSAPDVGRRVTRTSVNRMPDPPARSEISRRTGKSVPETPLAQREVRMGDRSVTVARPEGVTRSIERNARSTVESALAPSVSRRMARPRPDGDTSTSDRGSGTGRAQRVDASRTSPSAGTSRETDGRTATQAARSSRAQRQHVPSTTSESRAPSRDGSRVTTPSRSTRSPSQRTSRTPRQTSQSDPASTGRSTRRSQDDRGRAAHAWQDRADSSSTPSPSLSSSRSVGRETSRAAQPQQRSRPSSATTTRTTTSTRSRTPSTTAARATRDTSQSARATSSATTSRRSSSAAKKTDRTRSPEKRSNKSSKQPAAGSRRRR